MDMFGEVANIHMRTDAKNLVIYLNKKETIHMISMLRKEACSGSIHDLAHSPTQNCLADCLTKASAKADNFDHGCEYKEIAGCRYSPRF